MKNKGFVIMMFSPVLAVLTTGGVYAQIFEKGDARVPGTEFGWMD
jgi:hypothetical protein